MILTVAEIRDLAAFVDEDDDETEIVVEPALPEGLKTELYKDIGSGLNENRKSFKKLLKRLGDPDVKSVLVEYKDRICRYGFETFRAYCETLGVEVLVLCDDEPAGAGCEPSLRPKSDPEAMPKAAIDIMLDKAIAEREALRARVAELEVKLRRYREVVEDEQREPIPGADFEEGMIRAAKRILEAYDAIDKEAE